MRASLRVLQALPKPHLLTTSSPFIRRRGNLPTSAAALTALASDFNFYPTLYTEAQTRELLAIALWKLDRVDTTRRRVRRKRGAEAKKAEAQLESLQDMFTGAYGFEEGHFDSVIHTYRESLITTYPPLSPASLPPLSTLYNLVPGLSLPAEPAETDLPPPQSSTHVLHLAPGGAILPHVDNLEASGQTIVGASLGAPRILRLEFQDPAKKGSASMGMGGRGGGGGGMSNQGASSVLAGPRPDDALWADVEPGSGWDVLLPSGSVYVQTGAVRYRYEHSILPYDHEDSVWDGKKLEPGHRVSFMVRDAFKGTPGL